MLSLEWLETKLPLTPYRMAVAEAARLADHDPFKAGGLVVWLLSRCRIVASHQEDPGEWVLQLRRRG